MKCLASIGGPNGPGGSGLFARYLAKRPRNETRILVVEDHEDTLTMFAAALEGLGYRVDAARVGAEAIELARASLPDLALLDLGLPDMNGYDLAARLRTLPGGEAIELIALTGHSRDEDRRRSAECGFRRHLVKPIELHRLDATLRELTPARTYTRIS